VIRVRLDAAVVAERVPSLGDGPEAQQGIREGFEGRQSAFDRSGEPVARELLVVHSGFIQSLDGFVHWRAQCRRLMLIG
jgi:hypothetical protein